MVILPSPACTRPPPASPQPPLGPQLVGWLSPAVLAPPHLVGVKETLAEEKGMQGHILQLGPTALLVEGAFQL